MKSPRGVSEVRVGSLLGGHEVQRDQDGERDQGDGHQPYVGRHLGRVRARHRPRDRVERRHRALRHALATRARVRVQLRGVRTRHL